VLTATNIKTRPHSRCYSSEGSQRSLGAKNNHEWAEGRGRIRAATLGWGSPALVYKYLPVCCLRNRHRLTPREPLPLSDSRDGNQMKEGRRKTLCRFLLPYPVPYILPHPPALLCLALCILTSNITAASVRAGSVTSHAVGMPRAPDKARGCSPWWTPSTTLHAAPLGVPGESGSWTACDTGVAEGVGE
jgi:hypothetical protein